MGTRSGRCGGFRVGRLKPPGLGFPRHEPSVWMVMVLMIFVLFPVGSNSG